MKTISNTTDRDLPMPDGRTLRAKTSINVEDHVAGMDRVQSWGDAVTITDVPEPKRSRRSQRPARKPAEIASE